jgi:hypothetical protein
MKTMGKVGVMVFNDTYVISVFSKFLVYKIAVNIEV